MTIDEIHVGSVITGPLLPEPVEVLAVVPLGDSVKLIGKGCKTGLMRQSRPHSGAIGPALPHPTCWIVRW